MLWRSHPCEVTMDDRHTGGCLCGKLRFETVGPRRDVIFCHCSQCRRHSGLYYAATSVGAAALSLTGGENLTWFAASDFAKRGFCRLCGTHLFWKPNDEERYAILAGAFDDPASLKPGYHICTEGRAGFYQITDGLPQFPQAAPDLPIAIR
jgi:hypothetical protein